MLNRFFFAVDQEKMPPGLVQLVLWGVKLLISHLFAVLTRLYTSWQPVPERVPSGTSRPLLNALLMNSSTQQKGHLTGKKGLNHPYPYLSICSYTLVICWLSFCDAAMPSRRRMKSRGWPRPIVKNSFVLVSVVSLFRTFEHYGILIFDFPIISTSYSFC